MRMSIKKSIHVQQHFVHKRLDRKGKKIIKHSGELCRCRWRQHDEKRKRGRRKKRIVNHVQKKKSQLCRRIFFLILRKKNKYLQLQIGQ